MSKPKIRNPEMGDSGKSWNVVTGCDKYSDGCLNCYAVDQVKWLARLGQDVYIQNGFNLTLHHNRLNWPFTKFAKKPKKPAKSFVTEMGDLFHDNVPDSFIKQVFDVMLQVPQHRFYVLTKRAERFGQLAPQLLWTVESDKYLERIDELKKLPPDVNKFIMMEPLLSPMPKIDLSGIDWVVVGGETNSKGRFRPLRQRWVTDIRDQVKTAGLPFMFKHWSGYKHNSKPALLQGKIWDEYPPTLLENVNWQ